MEKSIAKEYLDKLNEAQKKYENSKYQKDKVLQNLKENQLRLAKWQQIEDGNKSHIINDEEMFNYIKSRFEDGTLKTVIDIALPLIKENLCKTIDNQLEFFNNQLT